MKEIAPIKPDERQMLSVEDEFAQRIFPADELGIPLSIYIPDEYRNEWNRLDTVKHRMDKHHRFAPKKFLIHRDGDIGKVLRYCCLQYVPIDLHAKFNAYYDKPQLPKTRAGKFGALLLSIARYLPAEAIDVSRGQPVRKELSLEEKQLIWANNELRPEQSPKVQREILEYVAKRDISGVDESLVYEFLTTPDNDIRIGKGKQLFRIAAEVAVEPIARGYVEAWDSGQLPRQDLRPENGKVYDLFQVRAVPKSPGKFVTRHAVKDNYALERALNMLQNNLTLQYAA
jgi:hypothetical protein